MLMQHQRDVARGAPKAATAGSTVECECGATPIEQDHRATAVTLDLAECARECPRQRIVPVARKIDDFDGRQLAPDPRGQLDVFECPPRLRARSRRGEDDGGLGCACAHQCDGASVVAWVGFLLVRNLVFLVDDDQAEVAHRGKDRGPRAHEHARLARLEPLPDACALALCEARVQHLDEAAKAASHPRGSLWRQRDLWDEDDHAPSLRKRVCCCAQKHFGLARAGDAVQQQLAAAFSTAVDSLLEPQDRRRLILVWLERRFELWLGRVDLNEPPIGQQLAHRAGGGTRTSRDIAEWARRIGRSCQDRGLSNPLDDGIGSSSQPRVRRRRVARGWQHELERTRRRRGVTIGNPQCKLDELGRYTPTRIHHWLERDAGRNIVVRGFSHHDTTFLTAAERDLHNGANRQRTGVRQWPLQSARRNERDDNDCTRAQRGARRPDRSVPT